ncbi:DNA/RNA non-specific endonuclease [Leeuwenhoekiella sp. NPDC079379]|uniref:DNA/RNA non-specific endonuclease n=1 Tax=Leeuwenhoekiella sp. NPDC079379 TaxID=3364122 RepID=UPI0037C83932
MNRKYTYPLVMMLAIAAIYIGEKYLEKQENTEFVATGRVIKAAELSYFLPQSEANTIVHHNYYSLSYNEEAEQAAWVAYTLTKDQLRGEDQSRPYFDIDPAVSTGAANWRNYKNSGYDRGHLCPAGDRKFSTQAYNETFLTSNISPQLHEFNSGIWNRLENQVRDWAREYDTITVVTAGVLNNPLKTIGSESVFVPRAFYKVVLRKTNSGYTCVAFLIPHSESTKNLNEFVITLDALEASTGIDFFPKLDDSIEKAMEQKTNLSDWQF